MTATPQTDAIAHAGFDAETYIARMTDLARDLEAENAKLRAARDNQRTAFPTTEYTVVEHRGPRELEHAVNELLEAGWTLVGGLSVTRSETETSAFYDYAQAMAR